MRYGIFCSDIGFPCLCLSCAFCSYSFKIKYLRQRLEGMVDNMFSVVANKIAPNGTQRFFKKIDYFQHMNLIPQYTLCIPRAWLPRTWSTKL
jgi:hypothetical protein